MALTSAKLWIYVTAVTSTLNYYVDIDKGTYNWGTVVEANETDFSSTDTIRQVATSIVSKGWKSFDIDVDDISAETIWVRILGAHEDSTTSQNITFASQNNATAGNRPYLELVWSDGAVYSSVISMVNI